MWTSPSLTPVLILFILAIKQIEGRDERTESLSVVDCETKFSFFLLSCFIQAETLHETKIFSCEGTVY